MGLLGANGAGKSTLLRTAAGLQTPDAGTVRIDGHDVWDAPLAARAGLGYAAEEPTFYEELSGAEHAAFVASVRALDPAAARERALALAAALGMHTRMDDAVRAYSHGMRKKLSFMTAVLHCPAVVLTKRGRTMRPPPSRPRTSCARSRSGAAMRSRATSPRPWSACAPGSSCCIAPRRPRAHLADKGSPGDRVRGSSTRSSTSCNEPDPGVPHAFAFHTLIFVLLTSAGARARHPAAHAPAGAAARGAHAGRAARDARGVRELGRRLHRRRRADGSRRGERAARAELVAGGRARPGHRGVPPALARHPRGRPRADRRAAAPALARRRGGGRAHARGRRRDAPSCSWGAPRRARRAARVGEDVPGRQPRGAGDRARSPQAARSPPGMERPPRAHAVRRGRPGGRAAAALSRRGRDAPAGPRRDGPAVGGVGRGPAVSPDRDRARSRARRTTVPTRARRRAWAASA